MVKGGRRHTSKTSNGRNNPSGTAKSDNNHDTSGMGILKVGREKMNFGGSVDWASGAWQRLMRLNGTFCLKIFVAALFVSRIAMVRCG